MRPFAEVSSKDFEAALTPAEVRVFQIIQGALGLGIALFLSVSVLLALLDTGAPPEEAVQGLPLVRLLSLVHIAVAVALFVTANLVSDLQFRSERLAETRRQELRHARGEVLHNPAKQCLAILRTALIVRLAMYEGIAMFGLVVCVLAAVNGVLQAYPVYWLNALTSVAFIGYVVLTFPTAERLKVLFLAKIKQSGA